MAATDGATERSPTTGVRVRFWGVRGSIPSPGPTTVRYGGNTSCITVEGPGTDLFVLDAGSGIRPLGLALLHQQRLPVTAHLFLTHTHWDHIQGFPFFVPAFIPGNRLLIHGGAGTDEVLAESLAGQMLHRYFPVSIGELAAQLGFQHVEPGQQELGGVKLTVAEIHHTSPTVGYRLEVAGRVIAYVTDVEPTGGAQHLALDPASLGLAEDADVLIHDAQYTDAEYVGKVGWGHSPLSYVVDLAMAARAKRLFLHHHDPTRTDEQLGGLVQEARARAQAAGAHLHIDAATEGLELVLEPVPSPRPATATAGTM